MAFEVASDRFSGPLHLLLELVEGEKLPITDVSLAKVAGDYLAYLEAHDVPTDELADFLVVATRLLLLKSRAILPAPEPEAEDPNRLADQLRLYKFFADASAHVEALYGARPLFAREKPLVPPRKEGFAPPKGVTPDTLRDLFAQLLKRLEPFLALHQQSLERVVSVQQRMEEIRGAILERSRIAFSDVMKGARSKVDVVVSFLALLELVKQRTVRVAQDDAFQDIMIRRMDTETASDD